MLSLYQYYIHLFIILPMGSNNSISENTSSTQFHSNLSQISTLNGIQSGIQMFEPQIQKGRRHKSKGIQNTCLLNSPKPRKNSFQQKVISPWDQDKYINISPRKQDLKKSLFSKNGFQMVTSQKRKQNKQERSIGSQKRLFKSSNQKLLQKFQQEEKTRLYQDLLQKIEQSSLHQDLNRIDCYYTQNYSLIIQQLNGIKEKLSFQDWKESVNRIILALQFLFKYQQGFLIACCRIRAILTEKQTFYFMKLLLQNTSEILQAGEKYFKMMKSIFEKVQKDIPQLKTILDHNDLDVEYFCMNWVLSLFSVGFPLQYAIKFWRQAILCQKAKVSEQFQTKILQTFKIIIKIVVKKGWEDQINYYLKTDTTQLMKNIQVFQI